MTYRTAWLFGAGCLLIGVFISLEVAEASEEPIRPGDKVVTTAEAAVKVGTRTLATVPVGTKLTATAVNGDWIAIAIERDGKRISGWIRSRQLARVSNTVVERPKATGSNTPGNEAEADDGPTSGLFQKLSLIPHRFGGDRRGRPYRITGEDMPGFFSVFPKGDGLEITARIPDSHGKLKYRGMVVQMSTLGVDGNVVSNTGANGYVWTLRVERIGEIDLSDEHKITELPSFDFASFVNTNGVIPFANGYAINLFGAIIENKNIVKAGSEKTYLNGRGRKLPGRIISRAEKNGRPMFEEVILR